MSKRNEYKDGIHIKLSSTFLARARCKYCSSPPTYYFKTRLNVHQKDIVHFLSAFRWVVRNTDRMCSDFYYIESPRDFKNISLLSFDPSYKSYDSSVHHKHGLDIKNDYYEYLTCDCGRTNWCFKQKAIQNIIEIVNRKSDRIFDKLF